jgi:outer membrane protein, heavy metal efflux system
MRSFRIVVIFCAVAVLGGCAAQSYRAAPLLPERTAVSIEVRSLSDPGLRDLLKGTSTSAVTTWPPTEWNLADLTLAAFYYNPTLQIARARVSETDAAVITARARPNPSINADLGGETAPESPWLAGVGFSLPIETAGKRKYRTREAQHLADVARWNLAGTAWTVRAQVRSALIEYLAAQRDLELLQTVNQDRAEQVKLLNQRLAVGMIPRPEVDAARILQTQTLLAAQAAQGRVSQAETALAAAIGVPTAALRQVKISWPQFDQLPNASSLSAAQIQKDAVLNRIDIRQALAQYAAADSALRLEIARQYPDIDLSPSYAYEEGTHLFSVGLSLVLPIFNRNQGPIAEAKARREGMAARFLAVQTAGIAASEQAIAKYTSALNELTEARALLQQLRAQERETEKAFESGQSDRVTLNGAQLQTAVTAIAQFDALYRAQQALGDLENAVQQPLLPGDIHPLSPQSPMLRAAERK